ncbi:alkyl/aryl-sulfatase [bacterium]|nr:alkyl/aryl-sulfatase [bacterium]
MKRICAYLMQNLLIPFICIITHSQLAQCQDRQTIMDSQFEKAIINVADNVYVAVGYGCSNPTMIIGSDSLIIVDTMYGTEEATLVMEAFREITDKPVKAIIYTHSHGDHTGGASIFADGGQPDVYARPMPPGRLAGYDKLGDILSKRAGRQFGSRLPLDQRIDGISMVYRPRGGIGEGYLEPSHYITESRRRRHIAGIELDLVAAPGETDDHLYVWLPGEKILICGDNFYHSFPNLYAVRGTPYRDAKTWINSLSAMIEEAAESLISGHSRPIIGKMKVKTMLTGYRDGINAIWEQTLEGMNQGLNPVDLAQSIQLPDSLADHPYLQQYFGVIPWTIRSIYSGYMGWFDGNPTNLFPLGTREEAERMLRMAGTKSRLREQADVAIKEHDYQWACQLIDYLCALDPEIKELQYMKARALRALAENQISSNARHYYLTCAMELEGVFKE